MMMVVKPPCQVPLPLLLLLRLLPLLPAGGTPEKKKRTVSVWRAREAGLHVQWKHERVQLVKKN